MFRHREKMPPGEGVKKSARVARMPGEKPREPTGATETLIRHHLKRVPLPPTTTTGARARNGT